MKLFQYWDQVVPPEEVGAWIEGFRTLNPEHEHRLFNETTAGDFIAEHYGPRELDAFRACAMPAMQADFFRLCAIYAYGGLYIDADNQCLRPLSSLIARAPHALLLTWTGLINNAFLMFRQARDPFIGACLALTTDNVANRRFKVENTSTGPSVLNAVRAVIDPAATPEMVAVYDNEICRDWGFETLIGHARDLIPRTPELVASFSAATIMHTMATNTWIGANAPAYKQTERHWVNWRGPIYR